MKATKKMMEVAQYVKDHPATVSQITKQFDITRQTFANWVKTGMFVKVTDSVPYLYSSTGVFYPSVNKQNAINDIGEHLVILPQHTSEQLNALLEAILNDAEPIIVNYTEKFAEAMSSNSSARLNDIEKSTTNIIIAIRHAQSILKEGTL
jgi:hypothetical protein